MKVIDSITTDHTTTVLTQDAVGSKAAYQAPKCDNSQHEYQKIANEGTKLTEAQARLLWPNIDVYRK